MTSRTLVRCLSQVAGILLSLRILFWIILATSINSQVRYSKRTTQLTQCHLWLLGFRFLSLPVKGSFQLSIAVPYFAIGLKTYLRLEVDASHIPAQYPVNGSQDTTQSFSVIPTWLSHFKALLSRRVRIAKRGRKNSLYTTSPLHFNKGFSLP